MTKIIPLTRGHVTIVDDANHAWLSQWKWRWLPSTTGSGYATRAIWKNRRNVGVLMHRLILTPPHGMQVDHINGDGLDNRRCNLRVCTRSQNQYNARKQANCSSPYKGVCWDQSRRRWQVHIGSGSRGTKRSLGRFDDEQEAARAYDVEAKLVYGEFARLNEVPPITPHKED